MHFSCQYNLLGNSTKNSFCSKISNLSCFSLHCSPTVVTAMLELDWLLLFHTISISYSNQEMCSFVKLCQLGKLKKEQNLVINFVSISMHFASFYSNGKHRKKWSQSRIIRRNLISLPFSYLSTVLCGREVKA